MAQEKKTEKCKEEHKKTESCKEEHKKDASCKEEHKDIKEVYSVAGKHLPSFDFLNPEFDLDTIDPETKHLVKEVAKKIFERLDGFKKILEMTIQPDVNISSMQEAESLTEQDHDKINDLYKRLMRLDRMLLIAELENTDNAYTQFIIDGSKEWFSIKKELEPIIKKLHECWTAKNKTKQTHHYLG